MFGHLVRKFYLKMDQEMQVYFMIKPDLFGNGQDLHYGKRSTFYFFWLFLGSCRVVFKRGIGEFVFYFHVLVFQYFIKREITFKISDVFYYYRYHFTFFSSA